MKIKKSQLLSIVESIVEQVLFEDTIQALEQSIKDQYDIKLRLFQRDNKINLSSIVVPKEQRGKGIGNNVMDIIKQYADNNGYIITLTPDPSLGGSKGSKSKLVKWYKQHGFVENKGRNKDYEISDVMYREPR